MSILICLKIQIVRGGKLLQFQCLVENCGKSFMVVSFMQYLMTGFTKLLLENFCGNYR